MPVDAGSVLRTNLHGLSSPQIRKLSLRDMWQLPFSSPILKLAHVTGNRKDSWGWGDDGSVVESARSQRAKIQFAALSWWLTASSSLSGHHRARSVHAGRTLIHIK